MNSSFYYQKVYCSSVKQISFAFSILNVLPHNKGYELKQTIVKSGHTKIWSLLWDSRERWIVIYQTGPNSCDAFLQWLSPIILLPSLSMITLGSTLRSTDKYFLSSKYVLGSPLDKNSFARQWKELVRLE